MLITRFEGLKPASVLRIFRFWWTKKKKIKNQYNKGIIVYVL